MERLPLVIHNLNEVPDELKEFYLPDASGESYDLQVEKLERPKPEPQKRRSHMTPQEKSAAVAKLGIQGFLDLPA